MKQVNIEVIIKDMLVIMAVLLILPVSAFAQERLSVTATIANMRSGPGTKYDVLWQVEKYHPVRIVEKKGEWYKIKDFENDVAWLHKSLLGKIEGVITIKDKCNVRSKPDTKSRVSFTVEKGVPFKVLARKGNWIKIEHADGDFGWIYKTLVW
ncbi:SH3 domain-containing protein [Desulfobacula sp.]|uniref:SH3 domain-containing protein n=1 Tax=Desulfobacula sp. TaxID=2593537 RepID=UPI00263249C3|nr:SH3 domain-containing protein [Desulfobacula sp.]